MLNLLEAWTTDPQNLKSVFIRLRDKLSEKERAVLSFNSRPGVSYSLRATVDSQGEKKWPLFVMADIIDDDPENRWLSICFYGDMIKDPDEEGDLVPEGLLGEDGYCFDLIEYDESMISYIGQRIDEAHAFVSEAK
ncbi:MAG: hypothetical protein JRD02_09735 [Deltaproteobacteria bacterium]|nr:hypothetical protein [Deltaproteobacteria bacterium]